MLQANEKGDLRSKHIDYRPADDVVALRENYQNSFNNLQVHIHLASTEGKTFFVREYADLISDPVAQCRFA